MDLAALATMIIANPFLGLMPFDKIFLFLASIPPLKNDILLLQPSDYHLDDTPEILLHSVLAFLSQVSSLPSHSILECWSAFKHIAWHSDDLLSLQCIPLVLHKHGLQHGFSWPSCNSVQSRV